MKMHIRHGTLLALLLFPLLSLAQVTSGPLSLTGTGCVQVSVDAMSQVAMNISGSWSGTIQPEAAIAGQSAANVQVTPSTSSTAASTITASGLYTATVAGYQTFLLCGNTVTGTATVYFSTTQRSASGRSSGGGGGGAGTVTSVLGTANQITSDGSTTTPTLSIPSTFTFPGTVTNNLSIFGATTSAQLRGVLSDESGTGAALFAGGNIGAATGTSLALSDTAANTDLSLTNTTAATSGTSQSSPLASFGGKYWTGAASAADSWTIQNVIANGTNPSTYLTLSHSGSPTGGSGLLLPGGSGLAQVGTGQSLSIMTGANGNTINLSPNGLGAISFVASGTQFYPNPDATASLAKLDHRWTDLFLSGTIIWTDGASTADTGLSRTAAGVIGVGNGSGGDVTGTIKPGKYATGTNCAAVGSAASPSVAACSSAAAGAFSCATNASAATCTINTTAVTANSEIFVTEVADEGTRLSVTCNTAPTVLPAITLASKTAGTGFTINLPTFTVNPACFDYYIVN